ncbi:MAG: glycosyltransferase family 39 protein [Bacteroidales bacterium]|nr:glycosyltransferase family 39 protein [Bacteroidales bacterium]MCF8390770.1 glycosyltransferase family 39 protein [Bacteroidales bacterium]
MRKAEDKYYTLYIAIILLLLIPALFLNLGMLPLIADEATRAIVSLEMEISGNLIAPTINGEFYFNKPPLYNWILLTFFQLSGNHSEWIIRLPAVISLILFGGLIYTSVSRYTNRRIALISALGFITSGRILFYDSMLGLIDLSFSLLVFLNFILIYQFAKKKNYLILFFLSYFIAAITFLMKGLPAVLFQGITLVTALIYFKAWRKLFSFPHLLGIAVFVFFVGGYYLLLWNENPDSNYFQTLLSQSTKRTFVEYGIWKTFKHLFTFPPEQLYNLLPWSLLLVFFFRKGFYSSLKENHFLSFLALIFIVNIPVYWISVESYPRYLFMLYPILIILFVNQYYSLKENDKQVKIFWTSISLAIFILLIAGSRLYFKHNFELKPTILILILIIGICFGTLFILRKFQGIAMELFIIFLLLIRIGFNLVILPERERTSSTTIHKKEALEVAKLTTNHKIILHPNTPISVETVYYISRERMDILEKSNKHAATGNYYIFDARDPLREKEKVIFTFETRWKNRELRLSQFE